MLRCGRQLASRVAIRPPISDTEACRAKPEPGHSHSQPTPPTRRRRYDDTSAGLHRRHGVVPRLRRTPRGRGARRAAAVYAHLPQVLGHVGNASRRLGGRIGNVRPLDVGAGDWRQSPTHRTWRGRVRDQPARHLAHRRRDRARQRGVHHQRDRNAAPAAVMPTTRLARPSSVPGSSTREGQDSPSGDISVLEQSTRLKHPISSDRFVAGEHTARCHGNLRIGLADGGDRTERAADRFEQLVLHDDAEVVLFVGA